MPEDFLLLCRVLLSLFGGVSIFVGWFLFMFLRLNPKKAVKTTGTLRGFREHWATTEFVQNYRDYAENSRGRRPVIDIELDGETCEISADAPDYDLGTDDIGKQIHVLYQRKLGVVLLTDNDDVIRRYLRRKRIAFGVFCVVGLTLVSVGILF